MVIDRFCDPSVCPAGSNAQRDFAERFERGKLSFTGDVLQV
jgi:hypothetical protein